MSAILDLFTDILNNLLPAADITMVPCLLLAFYSLINTLMTTHKMLHRENIIEAITALMIPYVLFGTAFIMEPLLTGALFGDPRVIEKSGAINAILTSRQLYVEIIILVCVFSITTWLFVEAAFRRLEGCRNSSKLRITLKNCGFEILLGTGLTAISVFSLVQSTPSVLLGDLSARLFLYAIFTVAFKTIIQSSTVLYAILFGTRPEKQKKPEEPEDLYAVLRIRRFVRKRAGYIALMLGQFLVLFYFAIIYREMETSVTVCIIYVLAAYLAFHCLYQFARFLFPDFTILRKLSTWGIEEVICTMLCKEFFDSKPVLKKDRYTLTPHFLVDEHMLGVRIYYIPNFMKQTGNMLTFSDGSKCRLNSAFHGFDMADYIKNHSHHT